MDEPNPDFEGEYIYNFGKYSFTIDKEHVIIDHQDGMNISFNKTDEFVEEFRKFLKFLQKEFNDTLNDYAYTTIKEWIQENVLFLNKKMISIIINIWLTLYKQETNWI